MDYKIFLFIGLVVIVIIGVLCYIKKNKHKSKTDKNDIKLIENGPKPIVVFYKSDGMAGNIFKVEFFEDNTYRFFNNDIPIKQGILEQSKIMKIRFLIDNVDKLEEKYCQQDGHDLIHYSLTVGDKHVILGKFNKNCMPHDFYDSIFILEKLIEI